MLLALGTARADEVSFSASAPMIVTAGESFRVEFSLNAKPDEGSFEAPGFTEFDVLAGPAIAQGRSVQIVNGSMTRTFNYTITYVLYAREEGRFTIGAASIAVDGERHATQPVMIEVTGSAADPAAPPAPSDGAVDEQQLQRRIAPDDLMLRLSLSKREVYKGEPVLATFKLYRRVPIVGYEEIRFPTFNGFWAQEIDVSQAQWQRETLDGKVYESTVVKQCLLYPQQAGTLTIEPALITPVAQVVVQSRNIDPIFGGGHEVFNVRRKLQTPRTTITVKELPAGAPAHFSGAVGRFAMESSLSASELAANSAATLSVRIAGTGNLNFVQAPKLTLPASFEAYDVRTTESMKSTAAGTSGYRQFEYPFIARADGEYRIDSLLFSYFSPERGEYVTLTTPSFPLTITPDGSAGAPASVSKGLSKEDVQLLGEDIRFIRLERAGLSEQTSPLLFSGVWFGTLGAILALFTAAYFALRKEIRIRQNAVLIRGRRANKVAEQRFHTARKYMQEGNRHAFYEEMLRALWGYMSDKFNIPVANLTKENVREELQRRGVNAEEALHFTEIISRCDEAQYSPAATAAMSDIYSDGVDLLSRIESIIKR